MASRRDLQQLRAQVVVLEARAARKVRRLARNGAQVRGTKFDPFRQQQNVSRYTVSQLEAYKRQLETFNSRRTQYHADANGRIMDEKAWRSYEQAQRRYNFEKSKFFSQYSRLKDSNGMRLAERMETFTPERKDMSAPVDSPFRSLDRKPWQFASDKSLRKQEAYLREWTGEKAWRKRISDARDQFNQMASLIGNEDLTKEVGKLSDKQFAGLWFYTNFTLAMVQHYDVYKMMAGGKDSGWLTAVYNDSVRDVIREIRNAKKWRV